jgi:UDP-2,3-diacylglucosamine pyrophosphatase LpxH
MNARWLADLGSRAYALLLRLNRWLNVARRRLGFPYWSVSAYLKHRVKEAVNYIGSFRDAVVRAAREQDVHGVICGHIHHGVIETLEGITYANTGDWVESCTALVEHADGRLGLVRWVQESAELLDARPADANSDRDGRVVSAG